jgi:adhesin transport system outer membrane protein
VHLVRNPLIAIATILPFVGGSAAVAQSFEDVLMRMLDEHPRIIAAEKGFDATNEGIGQARAAFLPQVSVSADHGYEYIDSPDRREDPGEPSSLPRTKATLTATQNLFSGFGNTSAFAISKLDTGRAKLVLERTRQSLTLDAIRVHNAVTRDSLLVQLATLSERTIARQLNLEDERVERGSGIAVDVLLAKTRLQLAKEQRVAFEGALIEAITRYEQVFGVSPATGELDAVNVPPSTLPRTLPETRDSALEQNIDLKVAGNRVSAAAEREDVAQSSFYPSVDLVGTTNFEDNVNTNRGIRRDYSVLLRVNWELFAGFRNEAASAGAAAEKAAAIATEADIRRTVEEDIGISWQGLKTAEERSELLRNASSIAREVFEARQKLRAAGNDTAINVLDAETEVFNARIKQVRAEFDARLARAQLLFSMGQLTPANLFDLERQNGSLIDDATRTETRDTAAR